VVPLPASNANDAFHGEDSLNTIEIPSMDVSLFG
jgi:hypothetical protein